MQRPRGAAGGELGLAVLTWTPRVPAVAAVAVAEKKAYPLRINAEILSAVQAWADEELRSANAQIEYVLREALRRAGRLPKPAKKKTEDGQ